MAPLLLYKVFLLIWIVLRKMLVQALVLVVVGVQVLVVVPALKKKLLQKN
jgi:hypothetical protein